MHHMHDASKKGKKSRKNPINMNYQDENVFQQKLIINENSMKKESDALDYCIVAKLAEPRLLKEMESHHQKQLDVMISETANFTVQTIREHEVWWIKWPICGLVFGQMLVHPNLFLTWVVLLLMYNCIYMVIGEEMLTCYVTRLLIDLVERSKRAGLIQ